MLPANVIWDEYRQYLADKGMSGFEHEVIVPKEPISGKALGFEYHRIFFGRCSDSEGHGLFATTWKRLEIYELILVKRSAENTAQFYAFNGRIELKAPLSTLWHDNTRQEQYNVETVSIPLLVDM